MDSMWRILVSSSYSNIWVPCSYFFIFNSIVWTKMEESTGSQGFTIVACKESPRAVCDFRHPWNPSNLIVPLLLPFESVCQLAVNTHSNCCRNRPWEVSRASIKALSSHLMDKNPHLFWITCSSYRFDNTLKISKHSRGWVPSSSIPELLLLQN